MPVLYRQEGHSKLLLLDRKNIFAHHLIFSWVVLNLSLNCARHGKSTLNNSFVTFPSLYYFFLSLKVNLNTLDVAGNRIKKLENISHLRNLEEFWVSGFAS